MENAINLNPLQLLQFITILLVGLLAGLLYGYDCSINQALGNLENELYLRSFQSINSTIQNPYFFMSFFGSVFALPVVTWFSYKYSSPTTFHILLSATLIFFIGVFFVTLFGNIPLNEQLNKFSIATSSQEEISSMRKSFEKPWNSFHTFRTISCIISFGLTVLSTLKIK